MNNEDVVNPKTKNIRLLCETCIQAGRVVDLHIPGDKETDKPKGFAFAEYETEEIVDYAVKLFTGLVTLYKKSLEIWGNISYYPL